jgi:hypothetical protein
MCQPDLEFGQLWQRSNDFSGYNMTTTLSGL